MPASSRRAGARRRRARGRGLFEASATPPSRDLGGVRRPQESGTTAWMGDGMTDVSHLAPPADRELVQMLPAAAYTSDEVLAWERRHLYAGAWSCLGRVTDLFPADDALTQRQVVVGDVSCLVIRDGARLRLLANTCRHRGHELLPDGGTSTRRSVTCPYHAWNYDLSGQLKGAPGFRDVEAFAFEAFGLVELPLEVWSGWVFG